MTSCKEGGDTSSEAAVMNAAGEETAVDSDRQSAAESELCRMLTCTSSDRRKIEQALASKLLYKTPSAYSLRHDINKPPQ